MCGCLSHGLHWGPGLQPRHVLWLGIEPVTLWITAHAQSTELHQPGHYYYYFLLIDFREEGVEGGREKNIDWLPPICAITGEWTCHLGMWPDQELNWTSQPTQSHVIRAEHCHLNKTTALTRLLSWLEHYLDTPKLQVWFLVRTCTKSHWWMYKSVEQTDVSLSPLSPL